MENNPLKYEYIFLYFDEDGFPPHARMRKLGAQGWRLVQIYDGHIIMERKEP